MNKAKQKILKKDKIPKQVVEEVKRLEKIGKHECHFVCDVCGNVYPARLNRRLLNKWHRQDLNTMREGTLEEIVEVAWSLAKQGNYKDGLSFVSALKGWIDERMLGKIEDK